MFLGTRKFLSIAILCAIQRLSASAIPEYEVSSIEANVVTFSNAATFFVDFKDFIALQRWQTRDSVDIIFSNRILFAPHKVAMIEGRRVICPTFLLRNTSQNNEYVVAFLEQPPTVPNPDTFSIVSIDRDHRTIILDNSTTWFYAEEAQFDVRMWKIGQIILIGLNGVFPPSPFDAVLFNTTEQRMIRAVQQ